MKQKAIAFLLILTAVNTCISQQIKKSEIANVLNKSINRVEFSKLIFFTKELVELGVDTSFQSKFRKKLDQHNKIKWKTSGDKEEYELTLHLLYKNLSDEKTLNSKYEKSKNFIMSLLVENKEIRFSVDENLVLQQTDDAKRGLINGYDEGVTDESTFVFFCYDPLLYKRTLLKNNQNDNWNRTGVFLCNYLRENENPLAIRNPIKEKILNMLSKQEIQKEFADIIREFKKCDVSSNLFD